MYIFSFYTKYIVAIAVVSLGLFILMILISQRHQVTIIHKLMISGFISPWVYLVWTGFMNLKVFRSIVILIDKGVFTKHLNTVKLDQTLNKNCYSYLILAMMNIGLIMLSSCFFHYYSKKYLIQFRGQMVSLVTLTENVNLRIKKVSDYYFKRQNSYVNLE